MIHFPVNPRRRRSLRSATRALLLAASVALLGPVAAASAQGTIRSDTFDGSALDTSIWTFVDPAGDSSVSVSGGRANVSVPAGSTHDVWGNVNTSTGLRQSVPNRDFEVEVKFDSSVGTAFQMQGMIVEQDSNDLVRAEVHHDGGGTRLFVATMADGNPVVRHYATVQGGAPTYMRVLRTGDNWQILYSRDGQSWTATSTFWFPLTVTRMGPLVGNSGGPPPQFTGMVDSFREILPDSTPPLITGIASTPRTLDATVSWTTDEPASSEVAYGPTTSYGSTTTGTGGLSGQHSVVIHGLACNTTYHFQVRSKDATGNLATGPDRTLTTAACPTMAESDEFNGAAIDMNRWTLVDPPGNATLSAGSGQGVINLPAGVQHDIWTGSDSLARLVQPAPNDDFELRVKFNSTVSLAYQMQGLVVQQDADDLLRLEVHYEGTNTKLFAASIASGTASVVGDTLNVPGGAPVYLRLRRAGNAWTFSWSADGVTWPKSTSFTRAMTVSAVGILAGNSGGFPPAFQAQVDWFHYTPPDRTPPVISGVGAAAAAGSTAKVTWTTDEPSGSEVEFGKTTTYASGKIVTPGEATAHEVVLHGLECATTYHYRVKSADPAGNASQGTDKTFTSGPCPALLQSDEFDAATLDTSKWAFVNPSGDGTTSIVSGAAQLAVPAGTAHDLWANVNSVPRLLQAAPDADFEVEVKFTTAVSATHQQQGLIVEAAHDNFLRLETFSEAAGTRMFIAAVNGNSAETIYNATVSAGTPVYYKLRRVGNRWTFSYSNDGEGWRTTTFDRTLNVAAVGPYVGNGGSSPPAFQGRVDYFREITDRIAPVVSQVSARPVSRQAQVTWTTDELSSSVVEFRQGSSGAWQTATGLEPLETRHSVAVKGMACATTYSYRVKSADALGNLATSATGTLTTAACTAAGGPDIDVWEGDTQTFGLVGVPQTWVNVTGNVSDPDGVQSLTGALNDNGAETLGIQPDGWRVQRPGDFNYEINVSELLPGANTVTLRATDTGGRVTVRKVTVNWQGLGGGATPSSTGPVLVFVAHPDDESLGMAGIIDKARSQGRRVYVAIGTNGEGNRVEPASGDCGAPADAAPAARYGLLRDGEARSALQVLGLSWSANLAQTNLIFLGYPGGRMRDLAQSDQPLTNSLTGVQRTYAEDFDGNVATCNGDFRYRLDGTHSTFTATNLKRDLDALLTTTAPTDVYTHASFDGHPDHGELARQMLAAVKRANTPMRVHSTIMHPAGDENCMSLSSERWPNPALQNNNPFARFTPTVDFTAPPADPCNASSSATSWGPYGAPNEVVTVPTAMQSTSEATNKKWQAISQHASQIDCSNTANYNVNCGFMRAFVKRSEFFWKYDFGSKRVWPRNYSTSWTSNASIAQQAQVLEGQWRYDGDGVRPLTTGFDRALIVGDTKWIDYDVRMPFTIHSFDPTTGQGAAVGLGVGWQGHTAWDQPRHGHPSGGLCLYARGGSDPDPFKLQLGYSPGPVADTTLASKDMSLAAGVPYVMRFRQQGGFAAGETRYSCKVWRSDQSEPSAWDMTVNIPDWPGTTGQRSGSAVLLAHETDATFGDVTISPLG